MSDFDAYWERVMAELAALPLAPELEVLPIRSTDEFTTYGVRFTSIGPYRLFAYYSVPSGPGPFPAVYHAPGYASVVPVPPYEERRRFVTLALCARGQRHSDKPFAAAYPGLLTHGIDDPETYVFRGIVADACRAVDFLLSRPEVDAQRIAVTGADLALIAAALRPRVSALVFSGPILYAARECAAQTDAYPLEELNDYLRFSPERAHAVWRTLAYFDPLHFAPRVRAATLISAGPTGSLLDAAALRPLTEALGGTVELYETTGYGYRDKQYVEQWLSAAQQPAGARARA